MAATDFRYRSSEEIQRENERTRAEIARTVEAIQARLSSAYWKARFLDGAAVVEVFRRHPLPSLLLTAGALWLAAEIMRDPASRRLPVSTRPLPRGRAPARPEDVAPTSPRLGAAATPRPAGATVAPAHERAADDIAAAREAATAPRARSAAS